MGFFRLVVIVILFLLVLYLNLFVFSFDKEGKLFGIEGIEFSGMIFWRRCLVDEMFFVYKKINCFKNNDNKKSDFELMN